MLASTAVGWRGWASRCCCRAAVLRRERRSLWLGRRLGWCLSCGADVAAELYGRWSEEKERNGDVDRREGPLLVLMLAGCLLVQLLGVCGRHWQLVGSQCTGRRRVRGTFVF